MSSVAHCDLALSEEKLPKLALAAWRFCHQDRCSESGNSCGWTDLCSQSSGSLMSMECCEKGQLDQQRAPAPGTRGGSIICSSIDQVGYSL